MLSAGRFGTRDLARAAAFYDEIAAMLNARRVIERDNVIAYQGADGGMFLIGLPFSGDATVGNGSQLAFAAKNRAIVDAVYSKMQELGGRCEGPPGLRGPEGPNAFYATYFRDLDGNKLVVACFGPAD